MTRLSTEKTRAAVDALVPFYEQLRPDDVERFDLYYRHDACFRCKTACKTFQISGVISVQKLPPWVV